MDTQYIDIDINYKDLQQSPCLLYNNPQKNDEQQTFLFNSDMNVKQGFLQQPSENEDSTNVEYICKNSNNNNTLERHNSLLSGKKSQEIEIIQNWLSVEEEDNNLLNMNGIQYNQIPYQQEDSQQQNYYNDQNWEENNCNSQQQVNSSELFNQQYFYFYDDQQNDLIDQGHECAYLDIQQKNGNYENQNKPMKNFYKKLQQKKIKKQKNKSPTYQNETSEKDSIFKNEIKSILGIEFKKWQLLKIQKLLRNKDYFSEYEEYVKNFLYTCVYKEKKNRVNKKPNDLEEIMKTENLKKIQSFYQNHQQFPNSNTRQEQQKKCSQLIDIIKSYNPNYQMSFESIGQDNKALTKFNQEIQKINQFNLHNRQLLNLFLKMEYPKILYGPKQRITKKKNYGLVALIIQNLKLINTENFYYIK